MIKLQDQIKDLESQVAKLKEDIENGTSHLERLISTLDDIKAYIKLYESRNTNYIYCKNELKAILAKHEGNTDTKSDLSKCIGMDKQ